MAGNPARSRWLSASQVARKTPKAQFTLPAEVLDALEAEAARRDVPKSSLVEEALRVLLELPSRRPDR